MKNFKIKHRQETLLFLIEKYFLYYGKKGCQEKRNRLLALRNHIENNY